MDEVFNNPNFTLLQELQLLQYFIPYFKITPKKRTFTCNKETDIDIHL